MTQFKIRISIAVLVFTLVFGVSLAHGQLTPLGDSYTNTAAPTTNYGAKTLLDVESASRTTYIQFDLSAIPSGYTSADITKASLKLYVNAVTTAGSFNVDYVNGTWSESTITYNNAPALGTTIAASFPLTTKEKNQYILIDITAALQAWLSGTTNDGIALVGNSPLNASFDSKENTTTSHPAELDIVFAGRGTITGVTTASGSGLTGGGTSGTLNLSLINTCAANQILQWNGTAWVCSAAGTGTITGVSGTNGITGGGTSGNVTLGLASNACASGNALSALPFTCSPFATLGANTFSGSQTVNGNLGATGVVTGSSYQIGSNLFAFGTYANGNAFLGFAGNSTMTGTSNTANGEGALASNTTGNYNTASGEGALDANTAGNDNTASGILALSSNTTGNYNTASGVGAGNTTNNSPTTGSNNTFLGANANPGTQTNLNNATAIGANAQVTASNALVLGGLGGNAVSVGIGTTAPAYTLDVHGTGNFTGLVTFAAGQTFPGTGTITGVTAGTDLTGGGSSGSVTLNVDTTRVVTGVTAGTDLTGGGTGGVQTLNLDTTKVPQLGTANTFTGNQTVNGNLSATGPVTGSSFQIGSNLFAFGSYTNANAFLGFAGNSTMTGTNNTASGFDVLSSNTTGGYNTASGDYALYENVGGGFNTASGAFALFNNTTGGYNTATGYVAGQTADGNALTGSHNTAVGAGTVFGLDSLTNATVIGANAEVDVSNALVLGGTGANAVSVGIDTTAPSAKLHVSGVESTPNGKAAAITLSNSASGGANWYLRAGATGTGTPAGGISLANDSFYVLLIDSSGHVGIQTINPSYAFTIAHGAGQAISDGWTTYSSRRWKTNIQPLQDALGKVNRMRGVSYDLKDSGKHEIGVIAEEVGAVVPEVVSYEENGKDARGVDYSRLTALLIEATKEQQREFRRQQAELAKALRQIKQQQNLLRAQSSAMRSLETEVRETRETLRKVKVQAAAAQPTLVAAK